MDEELTDEQIKALKKLEEMLGALGKAKLAAAELWLKIDFATLKINRLPAGREKDLLKAEQYVRFSKIFAPEDLENDIYDNLIEED